MHLLLLSILMQGFTSCLHVRILKVRPSKKRKRSSSHKVAIKKDWIEVAEEWMETAPLVVTDPMLASIFRIIETNPKAKVEGSGQPIEIGVDTKPEVKFGSHPIEEGEVNLDKKVPLPLQGSAELTLEVELILEIEEMQLGGEMPQ